MSPSVRRSFLAVMAAATLGAASASAQQEPSVAQLVDDFAHYIYVGNNELAEASARAILERNIGPAEFLAIIEDTPRLENRFRDAYRTAIRVQQLEDEAAALQQLFEQGRRERARSPQEIERNIELLAGDARSQLVARERLIEAKEYAVPLALDAMMHANNAVLRAQAERLLIDLGPDALEPLLAALPKVGPEAQESLANVLGAIGYSVSVPHLYELARTTDIARVRNAATKAIERISGSYEPNRSLPGLFIAVGDAYYAESPSLTRFPDEQHQLLWSYDPARGLEATPVYTEVFHEARAMDLAEQALRLNNGDDRALELWIRSNFSRQIDQPAGYDNPAYPNDRRDATFYAVGAGSTVVQEVLARALADRDTPLARLAIDALYRSAGGATLWRGLGDRRPLIDALSYSDRRTQYDAALVLASANPREAFPGYELVVPTLASAVSDAGERTALILASSIEAQQQHRAALEAEGWSVLPPASSFDAAERQLADAAAVDLVVIDLTPQRTQDTIGLVRRTPKLRATPVLALLDFADASQLQTRFLNDELTRPVERAVAEALPAAADELVTIATGEPLAGAEAERYRMHAIDALEQLAISRNELLRVEDAARPLIAALPATQGDVRQGVARVLSLIGQQRAQQALVDAAIASSDPFDRVLMLEAAANSAKNFGNLIDAARIDSVRTIAENGSGDEATAAAALLGSLNLPPSTIAPIIR